MRMMMTIAMLMISLKGVVYHSKEEIERASE